jgi:predicted transcriptional regulator
MTGTTRLKLSDEVKARIASAARQTGKTAHAFMFDALELQTDLAQRRSAFVADALLGRAEVVRDGLVLDADAVFDYLKARADGRSARKPTSKSDSWAIRKTTRIEHTSGSGVERTGRIRTQTRRAKELLCPGTAPASPRRRSVCLPIRRMPCPCYV